MRCLFAVSALLLSCLFAAPVSAQSFADYSGRDLFMRFCASCHGANGTGDGPVGQGLAVMVPDLTRLARRYGNHIDQVKLREIIDGRSVVIAHGTRTMPVWGYEFWVEEGADVKAEASVRIIVDKLIDYLRSIQT
jgi:mono/diheme cytochrome c family protein